MADRLSPGRVAERALHGPAGDATWSDITRGLTSRGIAWSAASLRYEARWPIAVESLAGK